MNSNILQGGVAGGKFTSQGSGSQGQQGKENFSAGKLPMSQPHVSSGMPFREHHLKQLRAQCLVFLAFRNGFVPKKLHLEIALGDSYPKEGGNAESVSQDVNDQKGKLLTSLEIERVPSGSSTGVLRSDSSSLEMENLKKKMSQ